MRYNRLKLRFLLFVLNDKYSRAEWAKHLWCNYFVKIVKSFWLLLFSQKSPLVIFDGVLCLWLCQLSMMKSLAKIVFGFIIAKCSLIGIWKASSYASNIPANFYLPKVNYRSTTKRCKICSNLTIQTPERRQWRRSSVFLLTLNIFHTYF